MAKTFKVKILTPSEVVIDEEVEKFFTQTQNGNVEFLAGHAPIILSTVPCISTIYDANGNKKELLTSQGIINIIDKELVFCCDTAEFSTGIDSEKHSL